MELFKQFGPCLYMDLDTMVVGPCDWLDAIKDQEFVVLRDPYRGRQNPLAMGSGIMYWSGDMSRTWEAYCQNRTTTLPGGDQAFLEQHTTATYLQDFTRSVVSYKAEVQKGYDWHNASIVYFHGKPRPWDQREVLVV
jgi:hypothetical protein